MNTKHIQSLVLATICLVVWWGISNISKKPTNRSNVVWTLAEKKSNLFVDLSGGATQAIYALFVNFQDAEYTRRTIKSVNPDLAGKEIILYPLDFTKAIKKIKSEKDTCVVFENLSEGIPCEDFL